MAHFHFINVVWGERYTRLLLDVVLPTELWPGNLPSVRGGGTYRFFTTGKDAETIRASRPYAALASLLPVEFVLIDDVLSERKYEALTECHRRAIRAANQADAALVFLSPDVMLSDGSFRRIREISETGKRVIALAGIRVVAETFMPRLQALGDRVPTTRELVRLAIENLHPFTRSCFWDSPEFSRWPSNLYWNVGTEGYVARGYHLHPLMVHPRRKDLEPQGTVDDDYLPLACPDPADWYVVRDSDEIINVDLTNLAEFGDMRVPNRADERDVAFWAHYHARPYHRRLSEEVLRFHTGEPTTAWAPVEASAAKVMESVNELLRHPYRRFAGRMALRSMVMALKKPLKLLFTKSRIERLRRKVGI